MTEINQKSTHKNIIMRYKYNKIKIFDCKVNK